MKPDDHTKLNIDRLLTIADYQVSPAERFENFAGGMFLGAACDSDPRLPLLVYIRCPREEHLNNKVNDCYGRRN